MPRHPPPSAPPRIRATLARPAAKWGEAEFDAVWEWIYGEPLDALIRFTYGKIYYFAGGDDRLARATDIVAEKLLDAWKHRRSYDPNKYRYFDPDRPDGVRAFMNWLYVIVARGYSRWIKRLVGAAARAQAAMARAARASVATPPRPRLTWDDVAPFLADLAAESKLYAEAVELHVREGLTHKEAGARSKKPCSEGTMKVRYWRALQTLESQRQEREAAAAAAHAAQAGVPAPQHGGGVP